MARGNEITENVVGNARQLHEATALLKTFKGEKGISDAERQSSHAPAISSKAKVERVRCGKPAPTTYTGPVHNLKGRVNAASSGRGHEIERSSVARHSQGTPTKSLRLVHSGLREAVSHHTGKQRLISYLSKWKGSNAANIAVIAELLAAVMESRARGTYRASSLKGGLHRHRG